MAVRSGELCTVVALVFVFEAPKVSAALRSGRRVGRKIDGNTAAVEKILLVRCNFLAQSEVFRFLVTNYDTKVVE